MILYSITGVIPYSDLGESTIDSLQNKILEKILQDHPLKKEYCQEYVLLTFEKDGIFYKIDVEA